MEKYKNLTDEELVLLYQSDTTNTKLLNYLGERFSYLLYRKLANVIINGFTQEDLIQDRSFGLMSAFKNYDIKKNDTFEAFATLCINRAQQNALAKYQKNSNQFFNESKSMDADIKSANEEEALTLGDLIESQKLNPEEEIIGSIAARQLKQNLKNILSEMEFAAMECKEKGYDNKKIAEKLGISPKSAENAVTRMQSKVRKYLNE